MIIKIIRFIFNDCSILLSESDRWICFLVILLSPGHLLGVLRHLHARNTQSHFQ